MPAVRQRSERFIRPVRRRHRIERAGQEQNRRRRNAPGHRLRRVSRACGQMAQTRCCWRTRSAARNVPAVASAMSSSRMRTTSSAHVVLSSIPCASRAIDRRCSTARCTTIEKSPWCAWCMASGTWREGDDVIEHHPDRVRERVAADGDRRPAERLASDEPPARRSLCRAARAPLGILRARAGTHLDTTDRRRTRRRVRRWRAAIRARGRADSSAMAGRRRSGPRLPPAQDAAACRSAPCACHTIRR